MLYYFVLYKVQFPVSSFVGTGTLHEEPVDAESAGP